MRSIPVAICKFSCNKFKRHYLKKKGKVFSGIFIAILECPSNSEHFFKKDEYPDVIISEIIDSKVVGYLNVEGVVLLNTIRSSTCEMVSNTAEISTAPLLSYFPMNSRYTELEKAGLSLI